MEQMFEVGETVYVIDCIAENHYFDPSTFPLKVEVIKYEKESREGDLWENIAHYQEYKVTDGTLEQWVTYEDLISEEEYEDSYNG